MKPRKQIRDVSEKRAAKLAAKGVKLYGSSIAPSSKPKKAKRSAEARWCSGDPVKPKSRKPIAKVGKQKAKRQARNRAYYASPEWRAKRKAVFQRDGYQCTETLQWLGAGFSEGDSKQEVRCPNRGEIVNGKQTARGLVAEETGYQHRGIPHAIDRIKTRCKDCDRRCTPLERINHSHGFHNGRKTA
jgi:hypothetical protein